MRLNEDTPFRELSSSHLGLSLGNNRSHIEGPTVRSLCVKDITVTGNIQTKSQPTIEPNFSLDLTNNTVTRLNKLVHDNSLHLKDNRPRRAIVIRFAWRCPEDSWTVPG